VIGMANNARGRKAMKWTLKRAAWTWSAACALLTVGAAYNDTYRGMHGQTVAPVELWVLGMAIIAVIALVRRRRASR
jgi:hypothetical protein